jgi:hypothetical protein
LTRPRIEDGEDSFQENRPVFTHRSASLTTTHSRRPLLFPVKFDNHIQNKHTASLYAIDFPLRSEWATHPRVATCSFGAISDGPRNISFMITIMTIGR